MSSHASSTVAQLRAECALRNIRTTTRMRRAELIRLLDENNAASTPKPRISRTMIALSGGTALTSNAATLAEYHRTITPVRTLIA